VNGVVR